MKFFKEHQNNENRPAMEAYMKNKFTFLGIRAPERNSLLRQYRESYGEPPSLNSIINIWGFEEREFQYIALTFLDRQYKKAEIERITLYEQLVVEKSWWDTVDTIAGRLISYHFLKYPELIDEYSNKWITSNNMWLNRVALLFQMKFKEKTDQERLFKYCRLLSESKEFFIQKAIGWALREFSYVNPKAVESFIVETKLSPLSKREGLKKIEKSR
ncbi:DNA alkylation repair protein [Bacillus sp. AFS002410]|uniref:DNA alkylation repair protein n=1 Tax=Bacillus sp. AFS002410 TaxID=2033481 RepID=UPI000BF119FD|nr:DNA alkylation repair protein [Bacillus sp. AFS002410]PEJ56346.1 DNA alkylation repair protein [Bacillus sp. AFS002410]